MSSRGRKPAASGAKRRRESRAEIAQRLADVIRHGAQGAALANELAREGVKTRAGLKEPSVLARLPKESQMNVLYPPVRSVPLSVAESIVAQLRRRLVFPVAGCEVIPVGSVRRKAPRVKDMDILVVVPPGSEAPVDRVLASVALRPAGPSRSEGQLEIMDSYVSGKRRRSLVLWASGRRGRYYHVDLFAFAQAEKPFALFHYTGSKAYNIRTRALAKRKGWRLNQYGVFDAASGRRARGSSAIHSEAELARFLGVSYRSPTNRRR